MWKSALLVLSLLVLGGCWLDPPELEATFTVRAGRAIVFLKHCGVEPRGPLVVGLSDGRSPSTLSQGGFSGPVAAQAKLTPVRTYNGVSEFDLTEFLRDAGMDPKKFRLTDEAIDQVDSSMQLNTGWYDGTVASGPWPDYPMASVISSKVDPDKPINLKRQPVTC